MTIFNVFIIITATSIVSSLSQVDHGNYSFDMLKESKLPNKIHSLADYLRKASKNGEVKINHRRKKRSPRYFYETWDDGKNIILKENAQHPLLDGPAVHDSDKKRSQIQQIEDFFSKLNLKIKLSNSNPANFPATQDHKRLGKSMLNDYVVFEEDENDPMNLKKYPGPYEAKPNNNVPEFRMGFDNIFEDNDAFARTKIIMLIATAVALGSMICTFICIIFHIKKSHASFSLSKANPNSRGKPKKRGQICQMKKKPTPKDKKISHVTDSNSDQYYPCSSKLNMTNKNNYAGNFKTGQTFPFHPTTPILDVCDVDKFYPPPKKVKKCNSERTKTWDPKLVMNPLRTLSTSLNNLLSSRSKQTAFPYPMKKTGKWLVCSGDQAQTEKQDETGKETIRSLSELINQIDPVSTQAHYQNNVPEIPMPIVSNMGQIINPYRNFYNSNNISNNLMAKPIGDMTMDQVLDIIKRE